MAEKLGIPMPKVTYSSPEEARQAKQRGGLLDIHERACNFFQEQLKRPEAAHAREYLKARGLDAETIATFRIGYAPESGFLAARCRARAIRRRRDARVGPVLVEGQGTAIELSVVSR